MSYNLKNIDKVRTKIFWNSLLFSIPKILINLIAYFGSLVTIFAIKFIDNGGLAFDTSKFVDWFLLLCLFLLLGIGIIEIRKEILKNFQTKIIVRRKHLFELIGSFRKDATYSVSNLSGDISWLREDVEITKALKKIKPNVSMEIFYDKSRVSNNTLSLFTDYEDLSAKFISYPSELSPNIKSVLLDKEDKEKTILLSFKKIPTNYFLSFVKSDLFEISIQRDYNNIEISSTISLIRALDFINKNLVIIGISGVNNVGKTTIVNKVREKSKEIIDIVPDSFQSPMESNTENALLSIFIQINELLRIDRQAKIIIFDRTPLDNYCYYKLRNNSKENVILREKVISLMKKFDIIINLEKLNDKFSTKTSLTTARERKIVKTELSNILRENNLSKMSLEVDHKDPESSDIIADIILKEIHITQQLKKIN
jgi:hypothetical protein